MAQAFIFCAVGAPIKVFTQSLSQVVLTWSGITFYLTSVGRQVRFPTPAHRTHTRERVAEAPCAQSVRALRCRARTRGVQANAWSTDHALLDLQGSRVARILVHR